MKTHIALKHLLFLIKNSTLVCLLILSCKSDKKDINNSELQQSTAHKLLINKPPHLQTPDGMVWVKGKTFLQGAKPNDPYAMPREKPGHYVIVDGFFIDITEVANKEFKKFVNATNYITVAERPINWEEMKKELPQNTQKPQDSILKPGSLIFNKNVKGIVNMQNYSQWWTWKIGANWKHPEGPISSIEGKDDFPVVHIALEDAKAYCKWSNRRLPTEAEWESAAQGNATENIFTWGDDFTALNNNANTWQGAFPIKNESKDGFPLIAPTKSYNANSIGIYDMLGNVWEITSDLFNTNYYKNINSSNTLINPRGASESYSLDNPYQTEMIIKGGSFLCNASYCASFRISAKMGMSQDSSSDHTGFRTVATPKMLENNM